MKRALTLVGAALIALTACSSTQGAAAKPHTNRNLITAEEIATISVSDAYEVVERLRPNFFATHGQLSPPVAYVDGLPFGQLETLHRVQPASIQSIQYLDPLQATQRYGKAAGGGAILVTTKH